MKIIIWASLLQAVVSFSVPKTSVGKFSKKDLRDMFADHVLPTA